MEQVINNVDLSKLDGDVRDAILDCFVTLPLKEKLIVFSKLVHGNIFKVASNDLFNMHKSTAANVFANFIEEVRCELGVSNMGI